MFNALFVGIIVWVKGAMVVLISQACWTHNDRHQPPLKAEDELEF